MDTMTAQQSRKPSDTQTQRRHRGRDLTNEPDADFIGDCFTPGRAVVSVPPVSGPPGCLYIFDVRVLIVIVIVVNDLICGGIFVLFPLCDQLECVVNPPVY